jgi:hypothetical protein
MTPHDSTRCAPEDKCEVCDILRNASEPVGAVDAQHISRDTLAMLEREWLEELRRGEPLGDAIAAQFAYAAACVREVAALHATPPRSPATVTEADLRKDIALAIEELPRAVGPDGMDSPYVRVDDAIAAALGGRDA